MIEQDMHIRLKLIRMSYRLSQNDVAEACGINRVAVSLWEADDESRRTVPTVENLAIFSKLTNVSMDWLVFGE